MCKARRKGTRNDRKPLIHCITNPIAMNQSANAVLAMGARPIMAEHPLEVEEITETVDALLLNLGNITDVRMEAMKKSIVTANHKGIPVVLDMVGIACSKLRREFVIFLLKNNRVDVIKGNYSEILSLYSSDYRTDGVDVGFIAPEINLSECMKELAAKHKSIVLATGERDLIVDKEPGKDYIVEGGCRQLGEITGTGCMLGAIIATELAFRKEAEQEADIVYHACKYFKQCGEAAESPSRSGTFFVNLMDELGSLK